MNRPAYQNFTNLEEIQAYRKKRREIAQAELDDVIGGLKAIAIVAFLCLSVWGMFAFAAIMDQPLPV